MVIFLHLLRHGDLLDGSPGDPPLRLLRQLALWVAPMQAASPLSGWWHQHQLSLSPLLLKFQYFFAESYLFLQKKCCRLLFFNFLLLPFGFNETLLISSHLLLGAGHLVASQSFNLVCHRIQCFVAKMMEILFDQDDYHDVDQDVGQDVDQDVDHYDDQDVGQDNGNPCWPEWWPLCWRSVLKE